MGGRFTRGALAGGIGAAVLMSAGAALAGSGVGGVFNLGQGNTVNATSTLSGATKGAQLAVRDTSSGAGATGVAVSVASGKPPITVSGSTAVANGLNADKVDGRDANALAR